ncbi:hypothetical protein [Wolbachia endosymbiont (group A) of Colletes cunicularius]
MQKADKNTIKQEFVNELQKKGEELFNQLPNDKEKKKKLQKL